MASQVLDSHEQNVPNRAKDLPGEGPSSSQTEEGDEPIEEDVTKALTDEQIREAQKEGRIEKIDGFDCFAGRFWRYPINKEVRSYQFNIVHRALYSNTLVVLPTGLGKTLIAAVVIYNFYLWYPRGKILFMAPTKPLVAQQMKACHEVVGIPMEDIVELTGNTARSKRREEYDRHRLFFLTPQVIQNDLSMPGFPVEQIRCVVVDEAHRATGNYAYCAVINEIFRKNKNFRVLALSATPGKDLFTIRQVVKNLLIKRVEFRSEESMDVQQYTFSRKVQTVVVPLSPELNFFRDKLMKILNSHLSLLHKLKALSYYNPDRISKYALIIAKQEFEKSTSSKPPHLINSLRFSFTICVSLAHALELLTNHGLNAFHSYLHGREKSHYDIVRAMKNDSTFQELLQALDDRLNESSSQPSYGHPKIEALERLVIEHFRNSSDKNTRVMIFSNFRNSVEEITELLDRHRPLIRPMKFIGQNGRGFTQKQQLEIVKVFTEGGYNTLIATCVAEEGLDIGNVDLIVCFDVSKSPIQLIQRMGRTGRHREGKIAILMTEGKEESSFKDSVYSKKRISHNLLSGLKPVDFFQQNQRLVPTGLKQICRKMFLGPQSSNQTADTSGEFLPENEEESPPRKTRGRPRKSDPPKAKAKAKEPKTKEPKKSRASSGKKKASPTESSVKRRKTKYDKYFETETDQEDVQTMEGDSFEPQNALPADFNNDSCDTEIVGVQDNDEDVFDDEYDDLLANTSLDNPLAPLDKSANNFNDSFADYCYRPPSEQSAAKDAAHSQENLGPGTSKVSQNSTDELKSLHDDDELFDDEDDDLLMSVAI